LARRAGRGATTPLHLLVGAGCALSLAGCFVGSAVETMKAVPSGSIELHSATLGDRTIAPTRCVSGERPVFLGADLDDDRGVTARVIVDPTGATTLRFYPTGHALTPGLLFRREDCSRLDLTLSQTGWQVNEVHDLGFELAFDCRLPNGDTASGTLAVAHCH
jgi:hypothetical protein